MGTKNKSLPKGHPSVTNCEILQNRLICTKNYVIINTRSSAMFIVWKVHSHYGVGAPWMNFFVYDATIQPNL